ncbi:MAG: hypothetical protein ACKVX7_17460 [Planctomycetota bacterium]
MANAIFIIDIGPDGVVATHPRLLELPLKVAPVADGDKEEKFNLIRAQLIAIGCMMLPGATGFEFDSSLVSPGAEKKLTAFAELMAALKQQDNQDPKRFPPSSIFGHADPTGQPAYNRLLSGRRAMAVYGLLTRNEKIWDFLFFNPHGGDQWGFKAIQMMLSIPLKNEDRPDAPPEPPPFFVGPIDGKKTKEVTDAIKAYQRSRNLPETGFHNDGTRHRLYREYMDTLCHDKSGKPFKLAPTDFLARGKDKAPGAGGLAGLRGDVQGCGEFNPIVILSDGKLNEFEKGPDKKAGKAARDEAYHEDRRVLLYVFKHGSEIDPKKSWPCPSALSQDIAPCKLRFWSDAEKTRLKPDPVLTKRFRPRGGKNEESSDEIVTRNTLGCRFYHAFAFQSPCEAGVRLWIIRFRRDGFNGKPQPLKNRRYVLFAGSASFAPVIRGTLTDQGELRIPVMDEKTLMTLKLDAFGPETDLKEVTSNDANGDENNVAAGDPPPKPDPSGDTDQFKDEDKFLVLTLDAGALKDMSDAFGDLPADQRLYNLGFGQNAPEKFTDEERRVAVQSYRRSRKDRGLTDGDVADEKTKETLVQEHEIEGAPEFEAPDE